jgi:hypothetical protein
MENKQQWSVGFVEKIQRIVFVQQVFGLLDFSFSNVF